MVPMAAVEQLSGNKCRHLRFFETPLDNRRQHRSSTGLGSEMTTKLTPGEEIPDIVLPLLGGGETKLGSPNDGSVWRIIIVYRGKHCGVCTRYLGALNAILSDLEALKVDLLGVSADTQEKAKAQMELVKPEFPVAYGLSVQQMRELGLFVSDPRSALETDAPFSEPGLFVVNGEGILQIVDIANYPFMRPDLEWLVKGIGFALNPENNYPIRGTKV